MSKQKALVGNAADESQVKEANQKEKSKRERELNDLRSVLDSAEGRRLLFRIITEFCHVDAVSAQQSGSWTYFADGERNIGRLIKADIYEADFSQYQLMEREYEDRKAKGDI